MGPKRAHKCPFERGRGRTDEEGGNEHRSRVPWEWGTQFQKGKSEQPGGPQSLGGSSPCVAFTPARETTVHAGTPGFREDSVSSASTLASPSQQQRQTGPRTEHSGARLTAGPRPSPTSWTRWGAWGGVRPSPSREAADVLISKAPL